MTKQLRNFFQDISDSILKFERYREWQKAPFSSHLAYLFGLLFLTTLISLLPVFGIFITGAPKLPTFVADTKKAIKEAYPKDLVLTLKNGELSTNVAEPYYYEFPKEFTGDTTPDKHFITIATASQVEDYRKFDTQVLVTKKAIVYPKNDSGQTELLLFEDFQDQTVDNQTVEGWIQELDPYWKYVYPLYWLLAVAIITLGPVFGAAGGVLGQLGYLLIFTLLSMLAAKAFQFGLGYKEVFKILMRASTLPILFFAALGLFGVTPPVPFAYSLVLGGFFLAICFQVNKASPLKHHE